MLIGQSFTKIDPKTCVGMWLFDDGKGDTAKDSSGNQSDGTLKNGPKWVDGKFDKALSFDGSDDYVIAPDSTILNPYPYTFSAWVKLDKYNPDANTGAVVMGNYGGDLKGSIFYISNSGKLSIRPHPGTDLKGNTTIPLQQWIHIATTLEGTNLKVYVNGKEDGSGNSSGYTGDILRSFVIGKASWYDGSYFNGIIDEVAVFEIALTEAEINSILTYGLENMNPVSPSGKLTTTWSNIKSH
jgi:hypothetical protein